MRRPRRSVASVAPVGRSRSRRKPHIAPSGRPRRLEIDLRKNPPPPRKNAPRGRLWPSVASTAHVAPVVRVNRSPRSPPSVASIGRASCTHRPRRSRQSVAQQAHIAPVGRVNRSHSKHTSPPPVACPGRKLRHQWSPPSVAPVGRRSVGRWGNRHRPSSPAISHRPKPAPSLMSYGFPGACSCSRAGVAFPRPVVPGCSQVARRLAPMLAPLP